MTPPTPRVAILGAGGRAGRAITTTAVARGHAVTAIVRDPARHTDLQQAGVTVVAGDALDPASISTAAAWAQVLVSTVTPFTAPPATFDGFDTSFYARVADTLACAAEKNGIERVVVIGLFATLHTADGGGPVADDPDLFPPTLRPFADAHAAGVDRLRETGAGLDWLVLAPPPTLGADAPSSGRYVLGDGTADTRRWETPLSYGDLAAAVLDQIEQPPPPPSGASWSPSTAPDPSPPRATHDCPAVGEVHLPDTHSASGRPIMPTFHDPRADAAEASEALRGLAHASRVFDDPADTYQVFGDLVAGVRSLRQVLDQLASTHLDARDRAFDDDGDPVAGAASALAAADELHQAGTLLDQAYDRLDAAFAHSGRIAWHPATVVDRDAQRERLTARLGGDPATTTVQAGSLALTVWPDAPVGEHQRYAYRITDTTTGEAVEGRDLFTGAGTPVDPNRALRDLATYLSAAGEARQYALDQPGSSPEHEGLFPAWVAEAARTNADALAGLGEHDPTERVAGPAQVGRRWLNVAFLQGEEADAVLDLIDRDGTEAAIGHLSGYDYGEETTQAALENGYVYDDQPSTGSTDRAVQDGGYALTYNHALGHVGLYREFDTPPDPATHEVERPASAVVNEQRDSASAREVSAARRAALGADRNWYAGPASASTGSSWGLSL